MTIDDESENKLMILQNASQIVDLQETSFINELSKEIEIIIIFLILGLLQGICFMLWGKLCGVRFTAKLLKTYFKCY